MRQSDFEIRRYLDKLQGVEVVGVYSDDDQKRAVEIVYIQNGIEESMTIRAKFAAGSMGFVTWFAFSDESLGEDRMLFAPMQTLKNIKSLSLDCDVVGDHRRLTIIGDGLVETIYEISISGLVLEDKGDVIEVASRKNHYIHPLKTPQFDVELYKKHLTIALKAHKTQLTPHGLPYAHHILSVAGEIISAIARERLTMRQADVAIVCALLHDVLEDTDYDLQREWIDEEIMQGVRALTKNNKLPKEERMIDSLERIAGLPPYIQMVKIADRITNLDPPPPHWDEYKIRRYAEEAELIKEKLRSPELFLWGKLDKKIREYKRHYLEE